MTLPRPQDIEHMRAALAMARRNLGQTWPNPSVGCIIVKDGRVLGRGTTAPGGRPHAEVIALAAAGPGAQSSTAYVTLEPCSHHGRTPPCADALIAAGVARVVIACNDPDPRVNGRGVARLLAAGIEVVENVLRAEAETQQRGFLTRIREGRPSVTLKLATTLDGRIATASGESQWITGAAARRYAHGLRATHDATLCGIGTVLADDPALTCRIAGLRRTPDLRIVLDTHLRTPPHAQLVTSARQSPTWILHHPDADPARAEALSRAGVTLHAVSGSPDSVAALQVLGVAGLTRVLVEGGAGIAGSLLNADMVDRLAWFHAPGVLGADAWPATRGFAPQTLAAMPRFRRIGTRHLGTDLLSEFERA